MMDALVHNLSGVKKVPGQKYLFFQPITVAKIPFFFILIFFNKNIYLFKSKKSPFLCVLKDGITLSMMREKVLSPKHFF